MSLTVNAITVDSDDPPGIAAFWAAALDRSLDDSYPPSPDFARLRPGAGGPAMMFIRVPEPRTSKNRLHLDLESDDREAEVARLVGLGAEVIGRYDEWGISWTTLNDPEGNVFCVAAHH
ncbi:VOC family protein [Nocardioides salsibiostraticola]